MFGRFKGEMYSFFQKEQQIYNKTACKFFFTFALLKFKLVNPDNDPYITVFNGMESRYLKKYAECLELF